MWRGAPRTFYSGGQGAGYRVGIRRWDGEGPRACRVCGAVRLEAFINRSRHRAQVETWVGNEGEGMGVGSSAPKTDGASGQADRQRSLHRPPNGAGVWKDKESNAHSIRG